MTTTGHSDSHPRFTRALPGWETDPAPGDLHVIGILAGEGVGPEIIAVCVEVLAALRDFAGLRFDLRRGGAIGLAAEREGGRALSPGAIEFCRSVFGDGGAVLCGPGGGRFVYELRAHFDLYCKLTPLRPLAALEDTGVLRPEAVRGVDVLVVRENVGGLYFGDHGIERLNGSQRAYHRFGYDQAQIDRILSAAIALARMRRKRLCLALKPSGVPSICRLWQERMDALCPATGVEATTWEVDTASYRLIADARDLDLIVAPNHFGDVLADGATVLLGSRGMSYSGNFGEGRRAVYQTAHGAAYDLAGIDRANPLGQIQSLAMMLRESFGLERPAEAIMRAMSDVLAAGWRTPDVMAADRRQVGTKELGARLVEALRARLTSDAVPEAVLPSREPA